MKRPGMMILTRPSAATSPSSQTTWPPTGAGQVSLWLGWWEASSAVPRFCQVIGPVTSRPAGKVSVITVPVPFSGLLPPRSRDRLAPGPWLVPWIT